MKIIYLTLIVFTSTLLGIEESKMNLYFSENHVSFDTPIIYKNKIAYIPIRSIIDYFDGQMMYSNKEQAYIINVNKQKFKFKENSMPYKKNGADFTFKTKPFKYQTRLYAPLHEFLGQLNYKVTKKTGNLYASAVTKVQKEAPKVTEKITERLTKKEKKEYNNVPFDYSKNKDYLKAKSIYLPIAKKTLPFQYKRINGIEIVNMTEFLTNIGYEFEFISNSVILKKNDLQYSFASGSNEVKTLSKDILNTIKTNYIPHIDVQKKEVWFPMQAFLNDLGFDYLLSNHKIVILKKLHSISSNPKYPNSIKIEKNSNIKLKTPYYLTNPNRIYWDFSFTKCPNNNISPPQALRKLYFGQHNTTCRMVFELDSTNVAKIINISPTISEISLTKKYRQATTKSKTIAQKNTTFPLKGKTIIIDPGHGGRDPGAVTKGNDYEKYYTLDISKKMRTELIKRGAKVHLLREGDSNPSLYQRVKKVNQLRGDFLISVHVNSFINSSANGTETYYYKSNEKKAAQIIQSELVKGLKLKNIGTKKAKMYILRYSKIPGVLIEPCFITNSKEYSLLKTNSFRENIAKSTVIGLEKYFKSI